VLRNPLKIAFAFAGILLLMMGCAEDDIYRGPEDIDRDLINAMERHSPTGEISFYMLPDDGDYSSLPQDPKNPITKAKVELGKQLFHETCISVDGLGPRENFQTWSCASCHHVAAGFQAGVRQGIGEGGHGFGFQGEKRSAIPGYTDTMFDVQPTKSPTVANVAYQEVMLWNGQFGATGPNAGTEAQWEAGTPKETNWLGFQGVETQAIAALKVHRLRIDSTLLMEVPEYEQLFDAAFGHIPRDKRVSPVTGGLAIAAYERTILTNQSPFQRWLRGEYEAMNEKQKLGAILFFGKAECYTCHTGPALNSMEFYAIGMNDLLGADIINANPDDPAHLGRGGFTKNPEELYQFKTPQIYNLRQALFFGHGSSLRTIQDVIMYKNAGVKENDRVPDSQLSEHFKPLGLDREEILQLTEFLYFGLHDDRLDRYVPAEILSGFCFPNNDDLSRSDLGCN
jgi:cytochrome c peroxidase